jgi:hypothetical protein
MDGEDPGRPFDHDVADVGRGLADDRHTAVLTAGERRRAAEKLAERLGAATSFAESPPSEN